MPLLSSFFFDVPWQKKKFVRRICNYALMPQIFRNNSFGERVIFLGENFGVIDPSQKL